MNWSVAHDYWYYTAGAERVARHLCDAAGTNRLLVLAGNGDLVRGESLDCTRLLPRPLSGEATQHLFAPIVPALSKLAKPIEGDVLFSSYSFVHHWPSTGKRIVYCHSPVRQLWVDPELYMNGWPRWKQIGLRSLGPTLRSWDAKAARRNNGYIATSRAVASRISSSYGIEAMAIIAPPVASSFVPAWRSRGDNYLFVGRIVEPVKRLEPLIEAFRAMPREVLHIAGEGPDRDRLESIAPTNVKFLGWKSQKEVVRLLQECKALICPSEEDFGLASAEAISCATPVLALNRSGARDVLIDGMTGCMFDEPSPAAIRQAVRRFSGSLFYPDEIVEHAKQFSELNFKRNVKSLLESVGG